MRRTLPILAALVLTLLACVRVVSMYRVFNETFDEPDHLAGGLELLQYGTYTYERLHPPLVRLAIAIGPYLDGARLPVQRDGNVVGDTWSFHDGGEALRSTGDYWRTLTLARLGVLPFLVVLFGVTFLWARSLYGDWVAVVAVALLSLLSPILGHAGVATLDVPCAATVTLALWMFTRWMDQPTTGRAVWTGGAVALAALVKFSSITFLGASFLITLLWKRRLPSRKDVAAAASVAFVTLWAGYGFSIHRLQEGWGPHPRIGQTLVEHPSLRLPFEVAMNTPLPLTELVIGVRDLARKNQLGHESYLLGESRRTGWWYFFPVVLAVKTPLGFLLLALAGLVALARAPDKRPVLFVAAIFAVCLVSNIDLGVRHILPIYPLLAMGAASIVINASPRWLLVPCALVSWTVADSYIAHPDYLAHFNEIAGNQPERFLAESDLDWGQDLDRLARRLRDQQVPSVAIRYFGSAFLETAGLPEYRELDPRTPTTGWIAISAHYLYLEHARDGSYDWLKQYEPRQHVGKSIDLFYIPDDDGH